MAPAGPGTGIFGASVATAICEVVGIRNVHTAQRSNTRNRMQYAQAYFKCLKEMRTIEEVAKMRGVPESYLQDDTVDPEVFRCKSRDVL